MANKITANTTSTTSETLFAYGTLRDEVIQLAMFGRKLTGKADIINGYKRSQLQINNPDIIAITGETVYQILIATGNVQDRVEGCVFNITANELELVDQYEVAEYKRVRVKLISGAIAWAYVSV